MIKKILLKVKEAFFSIMPIYLLVIILAITKITNLTFREILIFTFSTVILMIGMSLFNLGADTAMTPMGKITGAGLTKQGKIGILLVVSFILGFLITIAEPDLSVLASQTKTVFNSTTLIICISVGVGFFLILAILKTIFKISLSNLLCFLYMILFAITMLSIMTGNEDIIALAYDSGGVTTGPITVPFLMALGLGVSSVISNKSEKDAGFGLIALCSIGPIIIVLVLSIFNKDTLTFQIQNYDLSDNFFAYFGRCFLEKSLDVALAVSLIVVSFLACNFIFLKLPAKKLYQIGIGVLYTYLGLVFFLTAVESSYMAIGYKIGTEIATLNEFLIIFIGFIIGALTVLAEPAIHVLNSQVQEITNGLVKKKSMMIALTIGVGIAISLAMIRVIFKFSILYYLIPGYILCLGLTFFVPKIYSAIAFDSGGVASGPLTSSFILPLIIGVCYTYSGEEAILTNSFGVVALVAMTPLITIEFIGLIAIIKDKIKSKKAIRAALKKKDEIIIEFIKR